MIHCDDLIDNPNYPECLVHFITVNRMPAVDKCKIFALAGVPVCFATYRGSALDGVPVPAEGITVRLTMASRFGDIGITKHLQQERGYEARVSVDELSNFRIVP